MQHILVKEYDSNWNNLYLIEKNIISNILKDNLIAIYHIGSTSVLNLAAKPIIDIMVAVRDLTKVDEIKDEFNKIGYEYLGEYGIKGRRYLRKGLVDRTHQIHIFSASDENNLIRHLAFRDYLVKHEDVKLEYAKLKKELAKKYPYDIDGYCDGKDSFVKEYEKLALASYDSTFDILYLRANLARYNRNISNLVEAGSVAAAILTNNNHIYLGVCIDTACSLGMCAERNAIANMITNGDKMVKKLVVVMNGNKLGMPCGACRELLRQLGNDSLDIEILSDYETKSVIKLKDLLPNWWM